MLNSWIRNSDLRLSKFYIMILYKISRYKFLNRGLYFAALMAWKPFLFESIWLYFHNIEQVHRISQILADDPTAVKKKTEIHNELGLPPADLEELRTKTPYDFFSSSLMNWHGRSGSAASLPNLLTHLENVQGLTLCRGIIYILELI